MNTRGKTVQYQPRKVAMTISEIDAFVKNECLHIVGEKIARLTNIIVEKKAERIHNGFGPVQARELALRMFERSGGDILSII